jgi:hypothetical protein
MALNWSPDDWQGGRAQALLGSLGWKGDNIYEMKGPVQQTHFGDGGSDTFEAGVSGINPELQAWMDQRGYRLQGAIDGNNLHTAVVDANGNIVAQGQDENTSRGHRITGALVQAGIAGVTGGLLAPVLAGAVGAGSAAGGAGGSFFTMPSLGTIGQNALINGALSGMRGENVLKGALSGAVGGALGGFTPAAGMGITNPLASSLINTAGRTAIGTAINGGHIKNALIPALVAGGVNSINPAGYVGASGNTAGLINNALSGFMLGKDPKEILASSLGRLPGAGLNGMMSLDGGSSDAKLVPGSFDPGGEFYEPGPAGGGKMFDWYDDGTDTGSQEQPTQNAPEQQSSQPDPGFVFNSAADTNASNAPGGGADTIGYTSPSVPNWATAATGADWLSKLMSGVQGVGKTGTSSFNLDSLASLFSGITGKDVLGMIGSGVTAAMLADQANKNRDFQKELQDRQWAREDELLAAKRKRVGAPVTGGLLNMAITTQRPGG